MVFRAIIETILTYNSETWTVTESFLATLDAYHSGLLRAAFNYHWPNQVSNAELYTRAQIPRASETLRKKKLSFIGHLIRAEKYCPQAVHKVLLWQSTSQLRKGQGRKITYMNQVYKDAGISDTNHTMAAKQLVRRANKRNLGIS